jgi:hypothetical protein
MSPFGLIEPVAIVATNRAITRETFFICEFVLFYRRFR